MVTYWGYDNMEQVEGNMTAFRDGAFPIDSFVMDYDWWNTAENNETLDFSYDQKMFGPHTFVHPPGSTVPDANTSGPAELLAHFHDDLSMRWSGIRKPRTYSNAALSNASGWLLPDSFSVGAGNLNWNMSAPGWSAWYTEGHLHFLRDGGSCLPGARRARALPPRPTLAPAAPLPAAAAAPALQSIFGGTTKVRPNGSPIPGGSPRRPRSGRPCARASA